MPQFPLARVAEQESREMAAIWPQAVARLQAVQNQRLKNSAAPAGACPRLAYHRGLTLPANFGQALRAYIPATVLL